MTIPPTTAPPAEPPATPATPPVPAGTAVPPAPSGTITPPATAPPVPGVPPIPADFDAQRAWTTIHTQRESERIAKERATALAAENAELARKAAELDAIKQAQLTAEERAQQEQAQREQRDRDATAALKRGLTLAALAKPEHQLVDPEAAYALLTGVEYDTAGNPTNLLERIQALKTEKPYMVAQTPTPPTPSTPGINPAAGQGGGPGPALTPQEAQAAQETGMDPSRYAALRNGASLDEWMALQAQGQNPQQ